MNWSDDPATRAAAAAYPMRLCASSPASQFHGFHTHESVWNQRVVQPAHWPEAPLVSSPSVIIRQFQLGHFTQGLALTVSWGKMARTSRRIWGDHQLPFLEATLRDCYLSISATESIDEAWLRLTGHEGGQLGWSAVITSKALHFMCRALGFEDDPPVALDNAVMRRRVWPRFIAPIPDCECPDDWRGDSLDAYMRYMTAVRVWASARSWTTTDMEATLFAEYY